MTMKRALKNWLSKVGIDMDTEKTQQVCQSLGLNQDQMDACIMLSYQFEKGELDEAEFTVGMSNVIGKTPEETVQILRLVSKPAEETK